VTLLGDCRPARTTLRGLLVVVYLLLLFHVLALLRAVLPGRFWMAQLERRWIDLWLR
jgi:hypothetical protein